MPDLQHVQGLRELQAALKELPERIGKNVLRGAVSAGAAVIRKEAQAKAPFYYPNGSYSDLQGHLHLAKAQAGHPPPGTLKRSIVQKQIQELSNNFRQVFYVTVRRGKKYRKQGKGGNLSQDAYYAAWVEWGTAKMPAKPYMRPAFEAKKEAATEAIKEYLAKRIPEEAAKLKGATP